MINASNIWQFSASSKDQLERLKAAAQFEGQNKWIEKFKISPVDSEDQGQEKDTDLIECMEVNDIPQETCRPVENNQHVDFLQELVDADPTIHVNKIIDMCLQDIGMFRLLLDNLTSISLQKFCNHIFSSKDIKSDFLESFYKYFLPVYLKKEQTWFSLDILVKAKECHGEQFRDLLFILLNEKNFPSNILQEFVSTLNLNELSFFLTSIVDHDISKEIFLHNLYTMFLAYKDCHKDEGVQNFILKKLTQTSDSCSTDKNYGRFLLTFIQNNRCINNLIVLEQLVDTHRSAFKRPCINALNNLKIKNIV